MIRSALKIAWRDTGAEEYVALDFDRLADHGDIRSTLEWWKAEKQFVSYVADGRLKPRGNGAFELRINYEKGANRHLPDGALYGRSTVILEPPYRTGAVHWHGKGGTPESDAGEWKRVALDVVPPQDPSARTATRSDRQQAMLRLALLAKYDRCAITGETTHAVLEAAPVVVAGRRGGETLGTGILLRADLHRLYDAKAFSISRAGRVSVTKGYRLSREYQKLLDGKVLPVEVIQDLTA